MIKKKHYDLIFLDHMMPEMDGVETFHRMQELRGNQCEGVPVIALTANAISGAKENYLDIGFTAYISKPVDPTKLERLIIDQLEKSGIKIQLRKKKEAAPAVSHSEKGLKLDQLPDLEGFDWSYGMLHFPTAAMLWESVVDFYEAGEGNKADIAAWYEKLPDEEAMKNYRIMVHALKSNCSLIGYLSLSVLAKLLEYAARDNNLVRIQTVHPIMMEEYDLCLSRIAPAMKQEEKPLMTDESWMQGILSMLRVALEEYNYDNADRLMAMITSYVYEDDMQPYIDRIQRDVTGLDPADALQCMDEIPWKE
jgi:CheY-like chemotaxis protein